MLQRLESKTAKRRLDFLYKEAEPVHGCRIQTISQVIRSELCQLCAKLYLINNFLKCGVVAKLGLSGLSFDRQEEIQKLLQEGLWGTRNGSRAKLGKETVAWVAKVCSALWCAGCSGSAQALLGMLTFDSGMLTLSSS
jgi:hypothetical protein